MPIVTVLLPVYNGEKYLQEAIESILQQSFSDFEFLIIDDGSTDNSRSIIEQFSDHRIRLLTNPKRLRLSGVLNRGLQEAKGKYIARMDADDIALTQRLQQQVTFMESNPLVGLCGSAIEIFGENIKVRTDIYPENSEKIHAYALFDCPFCHPAVMLRKYMVLENELNYDGSYYPTEDYELWSRAIKLFPVANLSEVLLKYRVHEESMTGSDWDQMDRQATRIIRGQLQKLGIEPSGEDLLLHRNVGRGRSCLLNEITGLDKSEMWLQHLIDKNYEIRKYDERVFAKTVAMIWFRLCMNNSVHGFKVMKKFRLSSLASGNNSHKQLSLLLLSVLKNKFATVSQH
jgi:glycosyltransferase involved in cell wall biosynthesis